MSRVSFSHNDSYANHLLLQNKTKAFRVLEARLLHRKLLAEAEETRDNRRRLFKTADRREKMRTYNAAQVSCHNHVSNIWC